MSETGKKKLCGFCDFFSIYCGKVTTFWKIYRNYENFGRVSFFKAPSNTFRRRFPSSICVFLLFSFLFPLFFFFFHFSASSDKGILWTWSCLSLNVTVHGKTHLIAYPLNGQKRLASVSHPLENFLKNIRGVSPTVSLSIRSC